jgi:mono/diheme cytochrome c family protein
MLSRNLALLAPLILTACDPGPQSPVGFRLPDGDAEAGQLAFAELQCVSCHAVQGADLPTLGEARTIEVALGGKVRRVRTYGELVTAIIHPSHDLARGYPAEAVSRDGESLMVNYNDQMTVQQLIDLVAFLQSKYTEYLPKDYDPYFP